MQIKKLTDNEYEISNIPTLLSSNNKYKPKGNYTISETIILSKQNLLNLFDKLESLVHGEQTYKQLEEKVDQLEYELQLSQESSNNEYQID